MVDRCFTTTSEQKMPLPKGKPNIQESKKANREKSHNYRVTFQKGAAGLKKGRRIRRTKNKENS